MDEAILDALRDMVARHGRDYLDDPRRCQEAVRENLGPARRREAEALNLVLREGVAQRLLGLPAASITKTMVANSAMRISEDTGLREDLARWAIETWAEGLGLKIGGLEPADPAPKRDEPGRVIAIELDRPDIAAKKALTAGVVAMALSAFNIQIFAVMIMASQRDLAFSFAGAGSLGAWTLLGAIAGGIFFGVLGDRYGRVRILTWTILVFAVGTGLCALAQGYWDLVFYRTIASLGLGGQFGIGMALVAEAWPAQLRARACSYAALGWPAGVLIANLAAMLLQQNWRVAFLLGLVPGLVAAFAIRRYVSEPKVFIDRVKAALAENPLAQLVKDEATVKVSAGMLILCIVQGLGSFGLIAWLPLYLLRVGNNTTMRSPAWTFAIVAGMAVGIWAFGEIADRVGRRPTFIGFQACAIVTVLIYPYLTDAPAALIGGVMLGICGFGMLGGYGTLLCELYPTQARGTAGNVLYNVGRGAGGLVGPLLIGGLAASSFPAAIALLVAVYVTDIIVTALLIPERKGAPLG